MNSLIVSGAQASKGQTMSPIELFWTANQIKRGEIEGTPLSIPKKSVVIVAHKLLALSQPFWYH